MLHRSIEEDQTGHCHCQQQLEGDDAIHLLDEAPAQRVVELVKSRNQGNVFQAFWISVRLQQMVEVGATSSLLLPEAYVLL